MPAPESFLPPGGNYRELLSYRKAEVLYDFTHRFCEVPQARRPHHRPDGAGRPLRQTKHRRGQQGLEDLHRIEAMGMAEIDWSQTSPKGAAVGRRRRQTELKLTNVARASLEELLLDYEDFLRVRDQPVWAKDSYFFT